MYLRRRGYVSCAAFDSHLHTIPFQYPLLFYTCEDRVEQEDHQVVLTPSVGL